MNLFPGFGHKLHVLPHQMTILVDDVDIYHIINRALSKAVDLIFYENNLGVVVRL